MTATARRSRLLGGAAVAVALAGALAAALTLLGPGEGRGGRLAWEGRPALLRPPELPDDRILSARLRNTSLREIRLDAARVRLLDARGREVRSTARFTVAFAHGLYSPRNAPAEVAAQERERLGEIATVRPGASVPVTLSWRVPPGARPPVRVDLGGSVVELPAP